MLIILFEFLKKLKLFVTFFKVKIFHLLTSKWMDVFWFKICVYQFPFHTNFIVALDVNDKTVVMDQPIGLQFLLFLVVIEYSWRLLPFTCPFKFYIGKIIFHLILIIESYPFFPFRLKHICGIAIHAEGQLPTTKLLNSGG